MAASKCTIAFLLILAAVSATVHPSSAARIQADSDASPQPPSFWRPHVPLPPLPSFPCIPGLPRPRFLPPCNDSSAGSAPPAAPAPPQPVECGTSVSPLTACADFLTFNATDAGRSRGLPAPPAAACCDAVKALVKDAPICLCHVMNGDLAKLLAPAPMLRLRAMALPRVCGAPVPFGTIRQCIRGPVPPMDAAPAPPS